MKTFVAFTLLVAAVMAEPQYFYSGVVPSTYYGGYGGYYPYTSSVVSPVVAKSVVTPYAYTGVPAVTYPVQDTSRGLPQAVQDTPEVKYAKSAFAAEYASTVARNTGAVAVPVHNIHKRAAVFPVVPVKTPASTSPLVYSAAPVYHTPYVSTYGYGAYPYSSYPYVY